MLDDIIFNESIEVKKQLYEKEQLLLNALKATRIKYQLNK